MAERTAAGGAVVFVDHDPSRLAGAPDATYTITEGALNHRTDKATSPSGPQVSVDVQSPPGGQHSPPEAAQFLTASTQLAPGTHRLTVPASHSDVLLRALLTARPPWHVVSVNRCEDLPLDDESESPR
ncbi:hypothetical protein ACRAWF_03630 [Streptomyces sp. L7]